MNFRIQGLDNYVRLLCKSCLCDSETAYHIWKNEVPFLRGIHCICACHTPKASVVRYTVEDKRLKR